MNDPDEPIEEAAHDVEDGAKSDSEALEEEEEMYLMSSLWWFTSTACPLIAGTFGPMASAFNICALVQDWRVYIPVGVPEIQGVPVSDPQWLVAVNGVSLAFAIVANFALLLNIARRLPFALAQAITIVGWVLSSLILIGLVAFASSSLFRREPAERHALSQAFYYAIISAALYLIVSLLMVATVWGALAGHYAKDFSLSTSQRTLMIQTIAFMAYLLLGSWVFKSIEGWPFLDTVYWADFTLLTVGIGRHFTPATHTGRSLLFPYAFGGLIIIGLVVGSIRGLVLERGKEKIEARMTQKQRECVHAAWKAGHRTIRFGWFKTVTLPCSDQSELERREHEFNIMRELQAYAVRKRQWTSLATSALATSFVWLIGALVFMLAHNDAKWTYFVSLYFAYTSLLTIGFGDFEPGTNSARPFFVFWSLLAVPTLTVFIGDLSDTVVKSVKDFTNWTGSLTFLPEQEGPLTDLHVTLTAAMRGELFTSQERGRRAFLKVPGGADGRDVRTRNPDAQTILTDRLSMYLSEDELEEASRCRTLDSMVFDDEQLLSTVLVRVMRKIGKSMEESPSKKYDYHDWLFFLRLIGQDESDPKKHRQPSTVPQSPHDLGQGDGHNQASGESEWTWSWVGNRSPLLANKSESAWILERMSIRLEEGVMKKKEQSQGQPT